MCPIIIIPVSFIPTESKLFLKNLLPNYSLLWIYHRTYSDNILHQFLKPKLLAMKDYRNKI